MCLINCSFLNDIMFFWAIWKYYWMWRIYQIFDCASTRAKYDLKFWETMHIMFIFITCNLICITYLIVHMSLLFTLSVIYLTVDIFTVYLVSIYLWKLHNKFKIDRIYDTQNLRTQMIHCKNNLPFKWLFHREKRILL